MKRTRPGRRSPFVFGLAALAVGLGACGGVNEHPFEHTKPAAGGSGGGTGTGGASGRNGGAVAGGGGPGSGAGGTSVPSQGGSGGSAGGGVGSGGSGGRTPDAGTGTGGRAPDGGGSGPDASPGDRTPLPPLPPSGMTVTIGGKVVPKEKVVVFIHLGHSDMMGRATKPDALAPYVYDTHPQLWMYKKGGVWSPAKESTAGIYGSASPLVQPNQTGPGMAILRTALALAPDAYMVSIGKGVSGQTAGWCESFRKGALYYNLFMDAAIELKGKVTFGGIFMMFGMTQSNVGVAQMQHFGECLVGLSDEIRGDLGEPNIPLMVGAWNVLAYGSWGPNTEQGRICIPQMLAVPSRTKFAALIPTEGLTMQDDHHLDRTGHKGWAERGFSIMKMNGWVPWAQ